MESAPFYEFGLTIPRYAFSRRDVARSPDIWRVFQEAAVEASARAGWHPKRYRENNAAFLVRKMRAVHQREISYGRRHLRAKTWVHEFRRETFCTREIRLMDGSGIGVAGASQQWVHVDANLRPTRAQAELVNAFTTYEGDVLPDSPVVQERPGSAHAFEFMCWHTAMDPLAHVNHPDYLQYCDEGIARVCAKAGIDPTHLVHRAEAVNFRSFIEAGATVRVETVRTGQDSEGNLVCQHRVLTAQPKTAEPTLCATATTHRGLATGEAAKLLQAFD